MTAQFVPLLPSAEPPPPVPGIPAVLQNSAPAENPFAPLMNTTATATPSSAANSSHPAHAALASPEINFKREGDRITQIQIRCSCGEAIILDCDYGAAAGS